MKQVQHQTRLVLYTLLSGVITMSLIIYLHVSQYPGEGLF